ncbi:MAG: hypothetical protein M3313_01345 [Actinomycetota bacterium]|nr:hypothetical protein [Actinomycetota bacterium]
MGVMDRDNPHDIFHQDGPAHSFDVVIRGYDRSQVHDVVDRLDAELRVALADKDASAARAAELASHLAGAQAELESLRHKAESAAAPNFESMGARISHMLKLAEEEANDIRRIALEGQTRSQAELKATMEEGERVRTEAEAQAKRMTEQAQAEARRVTAEAEESAAKTIAEAKKQSDELNARARAATEQAELASRARVAKIEEDFQLAQKARRAEAARVEQERDQSSRRDAQHRIEQAQRRSDEMVAAAEQRVSDLDAQRAELHARLSQVRELLSGLPEIGSATVIEANQSASKPKPPAPQAHNGQPEAPENAKVGAPAPRVPAAAGSAKEPENPGPATQPQNSGSADTEREIDRPTDVQGTPPPPPTTPPSWPVNAPTQAIPIPRQG